MQHSKESKRSVLGFALFLGCAEIIGFAARFMSAVTLSVLQQLMVLVARGILRLLNFILERVSAVTQGTKRHYMRWMTLLRSRNIITTIERNNTKWLKVEINGYSLLVGRRKSTKEAQKSDGSTAD